MLTSTQMVLHSVNSGLNHPLCVTELRLHGGLGRVTHICNAEQPGLHRQTPSQDKKETKKIPHGHLLTAYLTVTTALM